MFEVICHSLTGNTRKVAEAIATELNVAAEDVKAKDRLAEDSFVTTSLRCSSAGFSFSLMASSPLVGPVGADSLPAMPSSFRMNVGVNPHVNAVVSEGATIEPVLESMRSAYSTRSAV